jgi:hypothetical protein
VHNKSVGVDGRLRAKLKTCCKQAARNLSEGIEHTRLVATDVASSRSASEAGGKLLRAWRACEAGPLMQGVARALICIYFINLVFEDAEVRPRMYEFASLAASMKLSKRACFNASCMPDTT